MPKLEKIYSGKHPNAVFIKVKGTKNNFIAKFYGHNPAMHTPDKYADLFIKTVESMDD